MNRKMIESISKDRIGYNCRYDAMSCAFEYLDAEYQSLNFVNCNFLYNKKQFLKFENGYLTDEMKPDYGDFYLKKSP